MIRIINSIAWVAALAFCLSFANCAHAEDAAVNPNMTLADLARLLTTNPVAPPATAAAAASSNMTEADLARLLTTNPAVTPSMMATAVWSNLIPQLINQATNTDLHGATEVISHLGIGVGVVGGGATRVDDASIVDGKVRVSKSQKSDARVMFEAHAFIEELSGSNFAKKHRDAPWQLAYDSFGMGLQAVVLAAGDNSTIDGFGGGLIFGFRPSSSSISSVNFGIGAVNQNSIKTLGVGFKDGKAPPDGATQISFKEESAWRGYVMASFSW
jgi:hypothetical protein